MNTAASTQSLTAYHWQMQPSFDANRQPVQLTFQNQRLSVQGLCNALAAGYTIDAQKMTITQVAGTMRMCNDPALMKYEQEVAIRLEKVNAWTITQPAAQGPEQAPVLTLKFDDGSRWALKGKPTSQTKYGSAGETVFLEIAPQTVPCSHPLIPNKQCLKVRTVEYDAAGLKRKLGEWQNFYDDIDGYTHEAGIGNILRVKRYTLSNPPADASRYAYVLDMTIESKRMP